MFDPYNSCVAPKNAVTKCSVFNSNFFMKKIIGFLSFASVLTIISCKPAETKKEVVVVPAAPVIIVKEPPAKSTTITLDKNGVKIQAKKVDVTVKN